MSSRQYCVDIKTIKLFDVEEPQSASIKVYDFMDKCEYFLIFKIFFILKLFFTNSKYCDRVPSVGIRSAMLIS